MIALAAIHGRALLVLVIAIVVICIAAWLLLVGRVWHRELAAEGVEDFEVVGLPERPCVIGDFWWCDWGAIDWPFRLQHRGDEG